MINVGIFNTGSGGKDIFSRLKKYSYISGQLLIDNKFTGNDTKSFVNKRTKKAIETFKKNGIYIIVIACHTAFSSIYGDILNNKKYLRNINIYEPILPVCRIILKKKLRNVTILSTKLTKRLKVHEKILKFKCNYIESENLAKYIDDKLDTTNCITNLLNIDATKIDCFVLGCTHYSLVEDKIRKILKKRGFKGLILNSNKILIQYIHNSLSGDKVHPN